jgi:hypothetical protein
MQGRAGGSFSRLFASCSLVPAVHYRLNRDLPTGPSEPNPLNTAIVVCPITVLQNGRWQRAVQMPGSAPATL